MSDLEQDLRDVLGRRANAAPATTGDWQDLTVRMARRNRHSRRMLAGALALVLVIGPLAGFAVARVVEDSDPSGQVIAGGPSDAAATGSNVVATSEIWSRVGMTTAGFGNLEKLFLRTAADGIAVRAYLSPYGSTQCQGDGWCPPVDCYPDAAIVGQLSTDEAVGYGNGEHYVDTTTDVKVTGGGVFGAGGEGSPARWTIAQVSDRVANVRVSYEGGGRDEMAPVDGVVLLAARSDVEKLGGKVEALDGSGSVVAEADALGDIHGGLAAGQPIPLDAIEPGSSSAPSSGAGSGSSSGAAGAAEVAPPTTTLAPDFSTGIVIDPNGSVTGPRAECTPPPPSLPEPGEQPADPAAARAEIERAFTVAYNGGLGGTEEQRAVVEDSDALQGVMEEIRSGSFAQQVQDASAKVSEVVFTSPTEAAVRYDINVENYTDFTGRIGRAKLIDGHWVIARETVCADIGLAGGPCPEK